MVALTDQRAGGGHVPEECRVAAKTVAGDLHSGPRSPYAASQRVETQCAIHMPAGGPCRLRRGSRTSTSLRRGARSQSRDTKRSFGMLQKPFSPRQNQVEEDAYTQQSIMEILAVEQVLTEGVNLSAEAPPWPLDCLSEAGTPEDCLPELPNASKPWDDDAEVVSTDPRSQDVESAAQAWVSDLLDDALEEYMDGNVYDLMYQDDALPIITEPEHFKICEEGEDCEVTSHTPSDDVLDVPDDWSDHSEELDDDDLSIISFASDCDTCREEEVAEAAAQVAELIVQAPLNGMIATAEACNDEDALETEVETLKRDLDRMLNSRSYKVLTMQLPRTSELQPCSRRSFARRLAPQDAGPPVPEEPFPGDCLPLSQPVACSMPPSAEIANYYSSTSAQESSSAPLGNIFALTDARPKLSGEAQDRLCNVAAAALAALRLMASEEACTTIQARWRECKTAQLVAESKKAMTVRNPVTEATTPEVQLQAAAAFAQVPVAPPKQPTRTRSRRIQPSITITVDEVIDALPQPEPEPAAAPAAAAAVQVDGTPRRSPRPSSWRKAESGNGGGSKKSKTPRGSKTPRAATQERPARAPFGALIAAPSPPSDTLLWGEGNISPRTQPPRRPSRTSMRTASNAMAGSASLQQGVAEPSSSSLSRRPAPTAMELDLGCAAPPTGSRSSKAPGTGLLPSLNLKATKGAAGFVLDGGPHSPTRSWSARASGKVASGLTIPMGGGFFSARGAAKRIDATSIIF